MSVIYTDGHLEGQNGLKFGEEAAQSGYTLMQVEGRVKKIPYKKRFLTNNEAEVIAIVHALLFARPHDVIKSDSQLAIGWVTKGWKVRTDPDRLEGLVALARSIWEIKGNKVEWIKRDYNPIT